MRLITAANERYFGRIQPYLDSLARHGLETVLVCVGGELYDPGLPGVTAVRLDRAGNHGAPAETESPQHGAWLSVVDGPDDEVLLFTDGDIILQRPLTAAETGWLDGLADDEIVVGVNSGPAETLAVEYRRLQPRWPLDQLAAAFGTGVYTWPSYNIGVMAARRRLYREIYTAYMARWDTVTAALGHAARQQWLVNYTVTALGRRFVVAPFSFHANGHYGVPPGVRYEGEQVFYGEHLTAFRHKL